MCARRMMLELLCHCLRNGLRKSMEHGSGLVARGEPLNLTRVFFGRYAWICIPVENRFVQFWLSLSNVTIVAFPSQICALLSKMWGEFCACIHRKSFKLSRVRNA